jgi:hypothetical protein
MPWQTHVSANQLKFKLINFHTCSPLWAVIIQFEPEHTATITELFSALAWLLFLCPDHTFGHYVNIENCFIEPRKQDFFIIHNVPCNSFYYFSTKSSHTSLQTMGGNSMHRGTKRRKGDNSDDHKEKYLLFYHRETSVHCSPMHSFPEPLFTSSAPLPKFFI